MTRQPLRLINPMAFTVPTDYVVDHVLIAEVIRETKNHFVDKPMTPVLFKRGITSSGLVIIGNIASYLVAVQLSLEVPAMEEVT